MLDAQVLDVCLGQEVAFNGFGEVLSGNGWGCSRNGGMVDCELWLMRIRRY